jgi:hypothetical protein
LHLVEKYGLEEPDNLVAVPYPTRSPGPPQVVRLDRRGDDSIGQ